MPLISVVVPVYNVERYLTDCLESLAQQTWRDLEVIVVDDGSTDASAAIARDFAGRDGRFTLVQQPNGGLGNARNTGADRATGDYLAFVDSDDIVTQHAYELLGGSLDETGSDFATGNFHRLTTVGTRQAGMVSAAFNATRLKTHVTKHPALLNDRTAWNKLWRHSFWTAHGFRWPEGVLYEDIPVTLPAHVLAGSVDVLRQPVYLWRARAGDSTSITQRRTEVRAITDRYHAVDGVSRFLAAQGQRDLKERYDRACAEQDLRYFMQPLDEADDEFRSLFLHLVNDFFDRSSPDVFDSLPAIDRLKYHLVRARLMPELLEVLRFEQSGEIERTPVIRRGRRFYGDYPFRDDRRLDIPASIYRLDRDELPLRACIEDVWWDSDTLRVRGYAHIAFLDLSQERSARIRLTLEESGHPESVVALAVRQVHRPDVTESAPDGLTCYDWSGFDASLPVGSLRHRRRFRDGQWQLRVEVRSHGITRRRWLRDTEPGRAKRPSLLLVDGARVIPTTEGGDFAVEVSTMPAQVHSVLVEGTVLELRGTLHGRSLDPALARVRVARAEGSATMHFPVAASEPTESGATPFVTRLALDDLSSTIEVGDLVSHAEDLGDGVVWDLSLLLDGEGRRVPLAAADGLHEPRTVIGAAEVLIRSTRTGRLQVVERSFRPEVDQVRWADDEWLELEGTYHEPHGLPAQLLLKDSERDDEFRTTMARSGDRFHVRLRPTAMPSLAGETPLPQGQWDLFVRAGRPTTLGGAARVKLDRALFPELPRHLSGGAREMTVVDVDYDSVAILAGAPLPVSQTGHAGRQRLQSHDYPAFLRLPRADQILFDGYGSGHSADDARALHAELTRRATDLDVLWSSGEEQVPVPDGVRSVARHGREWYEALARSRFVVAADYRGVHDLHPPAGQTVLQTWHGTPVTAVGLDDRLASARLGRGWESRVRQEAAQWDYLLSGGPAATAILRRAFDYDGKILETGLPRNDLLVVADRATVTRRVRERLNIADGRALVLYAPTYRPDRRFSADRYRLDLQLDLDEARTSLGEGHVLLLRRHPKVVDTVPLADGEFAVDVSRYPDCRELLLAADVLVTDYSSLMVDFATTGKPIVFYDYDLDHYRDRLRGLYLDPDRLPGPAVSRPGELFEVVADAPNQRRRYDAAYRSFRSDFCGLDDGRAAARVIDALIGTWTAQG